MRHSASLILLLWLVMDQLDCTSAANHREALHKVRSRSHYLQSVTNRFLVSDGEGAESLSTSSAKEASRISRPPSSDIDAKDTPATGEATQHKSTAQLPVPATDMEASVIVEKDRQRSTTMYPTSAAETPVSSRSLGVGGDAKQTSVPLDTVQNRPTTELPVPVTGAPQGPPVTATVEQQILNLKISITTTGVPEVGDQKTTPPNSTSLGNSKLSVPGTDTLQNFTLRSGGDHNWTMVNGSLSPRYQSDPKVHRNNTSQLTPIKPEENKGNLPTELHQQDYGDYPAIIFKGADEVRILLRNRRTYQDDREEENDDDFRKESDVTLGGSQRHGSRGLALLLYPIVSFMAERAATKLLGTVGGLVSGAASYVAFHPNLLGGANATTLAPVGG